MYEPAHLNGACTIIGRSMKGVKWQKDRAYFPLDRNEPFVRT